jgi:hypothetical protein
MTARSTRTATNEVAHLERAPFFWVIAKGLSYLCATGAVPAGSGCRRPAPRWWVGRSVIVFLVQSMVAILELLRAGYLPNRGASVTRRELRCPVK